MLINNFNHIFQSASLLKDRCPNAHLKLVFVHNTAYPGPEYGPFADMDNKKEKYLEHQSKVIGCFQLEFVSMNRVINHMTCYKFVCSHWLKLQHSDWRSNLVKDLFLQINFPPIRALEFIKSHVIFKLRYIQIY